MQTLWQLTALDFVATGFFLLAWLAYSQALERGPLARRSLNALMDAQRRNWLHTMVTRENRIFDAQIMASLQNGAAFFSSTALLAIGGGVALTQSSERAVMIVGDLAPAIATSRALWELKGVGLTLVLVQAFFTFAWSYRLFNYAAILMGAVPHDGPERADTAAAVERAIGMVVVAGRYFNRGQRSLFFALAYLGWFVGPHVFIGTTVLALISMIRRQYASDARRVMLADSL